MDQKSFGFRAWCGGAVCAVAFAGHFVITSLHVGTPSSEGLPLELLMVSFYLGWLGLGELRRCGERRLVREAQLIGFVLLTPVLLGLAGGGAATRLLLLASAGMLIVFALGLWHRRRQARMHGASTSG